MLEEFVVNCSLLVLLALVFQYASQERIMLAGYLVLLIWAGLIVI
jgi:hypothetical protein